MMLATEKCPAGTNPEVAQSLGRNIHSGTADFSSVGNRMSRKKCYLPQHVATPKTYVAWHG
jgi:hypothetical protein